MMKSSLQVSETYPPMHYKLEEDLNEMQTSLTLCRKNFKIDCKITQRGGG